MGFFKQKKRFYIVEATMYDGKSLKKRWKITATVWK